ncbi:MAG: hypothetical protein MR270_00240 [Erysipelotrichaceae bacterium]|nr:hypothetical protein [Erysipelotrichaceae bacterium]
MEKKWFLKAKPIWLKDQLNKKNATVLFKTIIKKNNDSTLKITASSFYRVFINKKIVGYGPARSAHFFSRVDEYKLNLNEEENEILIEVVGYNCNSYYFAKQEPFLIAEITGKDFTFATGYDFKARAYNERIEKVARFSFQRAFMEVYDFTCKKNEFTNDNIIVLNDLHYIRRNVDYPRFDNVLCNYIESGSFILKQNSEIERTRTLVSKESGIYDINELEDYSFDLLCDAKYIKSKKADVIKENNYEVYSCDYSITGFIKIKMIALEESDIIITYSEINSNNNDDLPIDVDYKRNDTINIIRYKVKKGAFEYVSFEPYTLRFAKVHVIKGKVKECSIEIVKYENPNTNRFVFISNNDKINKVMEAAKHVLEQNAVDILTDCPSRERAGWLCDSLFSAQGEKLFTGDNKVETNFLENYSLHPNASVLGLPEKTIAMCYPAEFDDHVFIPNWMLFYIIELKDFYLRTGNERIKKQSQKIAKGILEYLSSYENEYGLLENLPSWVFVEWSKANSNEFKQDVSFPTNMLYQKAIRDYAFLYDHTLYQKADKIKQVIIDSSYNGTFFVDNAIRVNNKLVRTNNISETCQYYAFYFNVANVKQYHKLYNLLLNKFGYKRDESKVYPDVYKSNAFIGNILRYSILVSNGQTNKFLSEAIEYYYNMAKITGTLWEHSSLTSSLNHGFGSYVAKLIVESLTGIKSIDEKNKIIKIKAVEYFMDYKIKLPCKKGYILINSTKGKVNIKYPIHYKIERSEKNEEE